MKAWDPSSPTRRLAHVWSATGIEPHRDLVSTSPRRRTTSLLLPEGVEGTGHGHQPGHRGVLAGVDDPLHGGEHEHQDDAAQDQPPGPHPRGFRPARLGRAVDQLDLLRSPVPLHDGTILASSGN